MLSCKPNKAVQALHIFVERMATEEKFHDLVSLRRALDERLKRLEEDLKRMSGDVHAQVEKRKSLARSLDLSRRLIDMYEQVLDSPHWDKVSSPVLVKPEASTGGMDEGVAFAVPAGEERLLRFEQNRNLYSLHIRRVAADQPGNGENKPAYSVLSFCGGEDKIFFAVDVIEEPTSEGPSYRPLDIRAFLPGNWIKDFLELSEQVAALKKELELRKKYEPAELNKLKKHFGL